jgi:tagatose-1,6-bisphosphate aldolase
LYASDNVSELKAEAVEVEVVLELEKTDSKIEEYWELKEEMMKGSKPPPPFVLMPIGCPRRAEAEEPYSSVKTRFISTSASSSGEEGIEVMKIHSSLKQGALACEGTELVVGERSRKPEVDRGCESSE